MIQDTKSSNGTFVNSQRLSKGGETSLPREFFSRDVIQFGVNVLENQRKGNEESDNSDESNHIGMQDKHNIQIVNRCHNGANLCEAPWKITAV